MRPQLVHRLLRLLSFALVFGLVSVALAQPDPRVDARAHYQAGMAKFNAAQYAEAIAEFQAAEAILPAPMNDYNIALSYESMGDASGAVRNYRSYLDRMPNASNRAEVEAKIAKLEPQAAAAAATAAAAEAARQAEEAAAAEAARKAAADAAAQQPVGPAPTGDPELDRVAAINIPQMRGAEPLPAPSGNGGGAQAAGGPAPIGDVPKKSSGGRPFYKSPVFWVLAAVGVYVLIVLADDNTSSSQSGLTNTRLMLPDNAPASSSAPALFRF